MLELAHDHILANILTEVYNKLSSYFMLFTFEHDLTHAHYDQLSQHRASKALHIIKYRVFVLARMRSKIRSAEKDIFTCKIETEEKSELEKILKFNKGAVIKYEADQGGRDCTGPPKILREECWVTKILPTEKMGHEILI